jgi:hypothetical protein
MKAGRDLTKCDIVALADRKQDCLVLGPWAEKHRKGNIQKWKIS